MPLPNQDKEFNPTTQLGLNLKSLCPDFAADTIVTKNPVGWKDTQLKIGLDDTALGITFRAFGKALANAYVVGNNVPGVVNTPDQSMAVPRDVFVNIATRLFGRSAGADRRITQRNGKFVAQEIQYTTLLSAVTTFYTGATQQQVNAMAMWIAVALQDAAGMAKFGGPVDIVVSRRTETIVATQVKILEEQRIHAHIMHYESRTRTALSGLAAFLSNKVGYYDIQTIAESLFNAWTMTAIEVRRAAQMFSTRMVQFREAVRYLVKGLPEIPDPLNGTNDMSEFIRLANFVDDVDLTAGVAAPPRSFAEARAFIQELRTICMNANSKIEIIPTSTLQKFFTVKTTGFRSGADTSELKDITLNYSGSDQIRVGEMLQYVNPYQQWSEDAAMSTSYSSILRSVMGHLRKISDIRLSAWASVVDNISEIAVRMGAADTQAMDNARNTQLNALCRYYALACSHWIAKDINGWIYGILAPGHMTMASSDAAYTMRGATTRRADVAVALLLTDRDGQPYVNTVNPFYKSDRTSHLLAIANEHYNSLGHPNTTILPSVQVPVLDTDGSSYEVTFPFSSMVVGSFPTTRHILNNVALDAEVRHIRASLLDALAFDDVLTGEAIVPILRDVAKTATDAFSAFVEAEVLNFPASMTGVKRNFYRIYTTMNCINILIEVLRPVNTNLAELLDTLFTTALADTTYNRTILGVL